MHALFDEVIQATPKVNKSRPIKRPSNGSAISKPSGWNSLFLLISLFVVFFIFCGRLFSIQVKNREKYLALAEKNRIREFSILPERGLILDRNSQVVVRNKPAFSIEMNTLICKTQCLDVLESVKSYMVSGTLNIDDARVRKEITQRKSNILLARGLQKDDILVLEANINNTPGISVSVSPTRDYLYGDAFSHLIGYIGLADTLTPQIIGKTGIEEYYNEYLSGVAGTKVVQVDSSASTYNFIAQRDSLPGKTVTLFIDKDLQNKAFELLKDKIDKKEATAGAIVAQDPTTGGVVALVSYPAFDPNKMSSGISQQELAELNKNPTYPFFNRAISAAYPPGSTFKLVTASGILMEKLADLSLSIFDKGYIQIGGSTFRNWKLEGHGEVNLTRALQVSNDTYFYTLGGGYGDVAGLGIKKLSEWALKFGFGQKTGIDLNGEVAGFMPNGTHRDWYLGDDYISAIGQGDITSTPLQVNNMVTYFANGGFLFRPRLVKSIDGAGESENVVLEQNIVDAASYDIVRQGMHLSVAPGGTGYPVFDFPTKHAGIELAGKTGTSEFIAPDGKPGTHAWFSVFGPYKETADAQRAVGSTDRPIAITVFLENGGSGSDDAAPLARALLDLWFSK
ncbi:penicillin-binding protein 2 [Patescibacteria group bacterium]|nr:penicillin-binding protein 2 [Patescibacteria group bacterium]